MSPPFHTILLLGGTGSLGHALCRFLLHTTDAHIRILSRSEFLQVQMQHTFNDHPRLRFILGDIRNLPRLIQACEGVDLLIHAAALKHIAKGEQNPSEFIATNIYGTENIVSACLTTGIKRAILVSSDKACASWNVYGGSKFIAERLFQGGNFTHPEPNSTHFLVIRYGNVTNSRGSVVPLWRQQMAAGQPLTLTSPCMTRFWMSLNDAVHLVWFAANYGPRGSILVPHLPAYNVMDLMNAVRGQTPHPYIITGVRYGEKLHETLIVDQEGGDVTLYGHEPGMLDYYCIPPVNPSWDVSSWDRWHTPPRGYWELFPLHDYAYNSETWPYRLSATGLQQRLPHE